MEKIKKMFSSKSSRNGTYSVGLAVIVIAILKTPRGPRGPQGPTYTGGRGPNVFFFGGPVYRPRRPRRPPPPPPPGGGFGNPGPAPVLDLAVSVRVPAAALAECPAGSVPAAVPPAAAVPGADNPFAR